ncbi:MAG: TrmH family RNA methyltransferase [Flavobacteriaceae bacterium]|jgi:TrmH family RNA methyltransferase
MILVSKSQIKLITSLQQKKYRNKLELFVAEGPKVINELITAKLQLQSLYSTVEGLFKNKNVQVISEKELSKISSLKNANNSLAVFKIPNKKTYVENGITVVLDSIQDPGNLGTIIRLCDWFDVTNLICSLNTVDCFNPKVIQATMGSIVRVNIIYTDIEEFLSKSKFPIYVGAMDGANIYKEKLPDQAIIVVGNEANGVSTKIMDLANNKITISQFGVNQETESLNVATAAAILLSEFKRVTVS